MEQVSGNHRDHVLYYESLDAVIRWVFLSVLVAGIAVDCRGQDSSAFSFETDVRPFLATYCFDCHSGTVTEGNVNLEELSTDFTDDSTAGLWIDVMHALRFSEMPPPEEDQPSSIDKSNLVDWSVKQLIAADRFDAYQKKLLAPEYGNWVNHEKLFSGEIDTPPFSPARLWRLSPEIFVSKGLGKAKSPFTYITSERGIRDYSAISLADQSTVQMKIIVADAFLAEREARGDFESFVAKGDTELDPQFLGGVIRREYQRIVGRQPDEQEQTKYLNFLQKNIELGGPLDALKTTIKAIFLSPEAIYRMEFGLGEEDEYGRRHLSPDELAYAISYALTNRGPHHNPFIKAAIESKSLSSRDDVKRLVQKIVDEQLTTGNWHRKDLPRIKRFFEEYFGFHRAGAVFKDNERRHSERIRQWNPEMLIFDANLLIEHILKKDENVIAELLTTNKFFIAHPGDNAYARERYTEKIAEVTDPGYVESQVDRRREQIARDFNFEEMPEKAQQALDATRKEADQIVANFKKAMARGQYMHPSFPFTEKSRGIGDLLYIDPYNLPSTGRTEEQSWNWPLQQPLQMPSSQRAGLLTHPAWLAAHSLNEDNDPIHRGIWVYERLLAGVLGDVPPDVDASVPIDPHMTLRERMEPLRDDRCWKCHRKINPLGETFEVFDDWGRFRTHHFFDENEEIYLRRDGQFDQKLTRGELTTRPVDATAEIALPDVPELNGEVKDAIELMHQLGHSSRVRQSFIRHLFRYFMGRNEMLSDSKTLMDAEQAYLSSGGSFKALVVSLLSSDSFLYRR